MRFSMPRAYDIYDVCLRNTFVSNRILRKHAASHAQCFRSNRPASLCNLYQSASHLKLQLAAPPLLKRALTRAGVVERNCQKHVQARPLLCILSISARMTCAPICAASTHLLTCKRVFVFVAPGILGQNKFVLPLAKKNRKR